MGIKPCFTLWKGQFFNQAKPFKNIKGLVKRALLVESKIASRILGYDMENNTDELTITDLDLEGQEVFLWLDYHSAK